MKYIIPFILFLSISSCKSTNKPANEVVNSSKIIPQNNILTLSSIFNSYKLIQLSGITFTSIQKVEFIDSLLIIKGKAADSELHIFNATGEYIQSIIKTGRGSEETLNIQDFIIDYDKRNVDILCDYGRKIITYSLEKRKIINTTEICSEIFSAQNLQKIDSNRYILYKQCGFTNDKEYKINIYNIQKNFLENGFLPINKKSSEYISFSQYNNLYKNNNNFYFYETFIDTIYRCTSQKIEAYWYFDKQKYTFPQKLLYKGYQGLNEFIDICRNNQYIWGHINVFEYKDMFFSLFNYNKALYLNITNKTNKESTSYTKIYDDLITNEKLELTQLIQIGNNTKYCFFYIEPFELLEIIDTKKQKNIYAEYREKFQNNCRFIEKLNLDANSILVLLEKK